VIFYSCNLAANALNICAWSCKESFQCGTKCNEKGEHDARETALVCGRGGICVVKWWI